MSIVVYDVETTGLVRGFDQILHFAAIRTDDALAEIGRFEARSRLLPHIIPAPSALRLTGVRIDEIISAHRPSHYEMVCEICRALTEWCPAVFLGFNSIRFDEEFLRQALYQCLHEPFLTNTNGCVRADVLKLARAIASMHPDLLIAPRGEDGRPSFRLGDLAAANGFHIRQGHHAMADVEATLFLCRLAMERAPEIWSRFLRFAQKAAVIDFIREEEAFVLFEFFGGRQEAHVLTLVGVNEEQTNIHYCLDLTLDADALRRMTAEELTARLKAEPRPVRKIKANAAPLLCPLFDAAPEHLGGLAEDEVVRRANSIRADGDFVQRLALAAKACEPVYDPSPHVEEQLYSHGFPTDPDRKLMKLFHATPWQDRVAMAGQFHDARLRRLARRLLYFERPDLLAQTARQAAGDEIARRLLGTSGKGGPWLTIPDALSELDKLLPDTTGDALDRLLAYQGYLGEQRARLIHVA